jgi:hypothetical protein
MLQDQYVLNFFKYSNGQEVQILNSYTSSYIFRPVNLCRTVIMFARFIYSSGYVASSLPILTLLRRIAGCFI